MSFSNSPVLRFLIRFDMLLGAESGGGMLRKLLAGEIRTRGQKNVVQARSFAELLENAIKKYQNRAIETAQVIEELSAQELVKSVRSS